MQLTVDWLQAGLLNEHTAAVGERGLVVEMRRRPVDRTRLCLKIHHGSVKMPQAYLLQSVDTICCCNLLLLGSYDILLLKF